MNTNYWLIMQYNCYKLYNESYDKNTYTFKHTIQWWKWTVEYIENVLKRLVFKITYKVYAVKSV